MDQIGIINYIGLLISSNKKDNLFTFQIIAYIYYSCSNKLYIVKTTKISKYMNKNTPSLVKKQSYIYVFIQKKKQECQKVHSFVYPKDSSPRTHFNYQQNANSRRNQPKNFNPTKMIEQNKIGKNHDIYKMQVSDNEYKRQRLVRQQQEMHKSLIVKMKMQFFRNQIDNITDNYQIVYIQPANNQEKIQEVLRNKVLFEDCVFYHNDRSLYGSSKPLQDWKSLKWKRISQIWPTARLFQGKISPNDIKQGLLGIAYFLAGVSALAEKPHRLVSLFLQSEQNNNKKMYSIKLLHKGKWRKIYLDEYALFKQNLPAFSQTKKDELWLILLEKAWAKLYGSFMQIQSGFPEQPLHDLTGAPVKTIFLKKTNQQYLWSYLLEANQKEYAIVASSNPGNPKTQSIDGIQQGHTYTLINTIQISYKNRRQKVIQLRNQFSKQQFKGRWSDYDPVWNSVSLQQKKRIGYQKDSKEGTFFMDFEIFIYEFHNIAVAEIVDNASYVYESYIDQDCKGGYFAIQIRNSGIYSLQIDKTPERSYSNQNNFQFPKTQIQIGKLIQNSVRKLQKPSTSTKNRSLNKSLYLEKGTYITKVSMNFNKNFQKDYEIVLAVYSQKICKIRIATQTQEKYFSESPTYTEQEQSNNYSNFHPNPTSALDITFGLSSDSSLQSNPQDQINTYDQSNPESYTTQNSSHKIRKALKFLDPKLNFSLSYSENSNDFLQIQKSGDTQCFQLKKSANQVEKMEELNYLNQNSEKEEYIVDNSQIKQLSSKGFGTLKEQQNPLLTLEQEQSIFLYQNSEESSSIIYETRSIDQKSSEVITNWQHLIEDFDISLEISRQIRIKPKISSSQQKLYQ